MIISIVGSKNQINKFKDGPISQGTYGPLSALGFYSAGTVTKAKIDKFVAHGPERKVGLVVYLKLYDQDKNDNLTTEELVF